MKKTTTFFSALTSCLLLVFNSVFAAETPAGFADLVEKLTPSVVNISTTQKVKSNMPGQMQMFGLPEGTELPPEFRDFFEQFGNPGGGGRQQRNGAGAAEHEVYSLGSGFIIDENGYVATNNHVISGAESINVILSDGTKLKAKLVGRDPKTDLALLKVDAGHKLPAVALADSDKARVGDWVIAIGNPFGLGGTVTAGIISARARHLNAGAFDDFIQTDAAINQGNSGGPLFNMNGEVVGINTAIFSTNGGGNVGIGFARPSTLAKSVFAQLKTSGKIDRGWLGVKIQQVTDEIAESVKLGKTYGALVTEVSKDSPSDKAGIKSGDVITKFDGKEVKEMRDLPTLVAETPIGKQVEVQIWRDGQTQTVAVKVSEMKNAEEAEEEGEEDAPPQAAKGGREVLGLTLAPLTDEIRQKFGYGSDFKGVVISKMKPESPANNTGIQPGDIIVQVGETVTALPKDVLDAVTKARSQNHRYVLIRVLRGKGMSLFVTVSLNEKEPQP